jgi:hypothetical protein
MGAGRRSSRSPVRGGGGCLLVGRGVEGKPSPTACLSVLELWRMEWVSGSRTSLCRSNVYVLEYTSIDLFLASYRRGRFSLSSEDLIEYQDRMKPDHFVPFNFVYSSIETCFLSLRHLIHFQARGKAIHSPDSPHIMQNVSECQLYTHILTCRQVEL